MDLYNLKFMVRVQSILFEIINTLNIITTNLSALFNFMNYNIKEVIKKDKRLQYPNHHSDHF